MEPIRLHEPDRGDELDLLALPAWHDDAACADVPTSAFYPDRDGEQDPARTIAAAKAVCQSCPAQAPCLAWALEHDELGVWGGTTAGERDRLRRGEPLHEPTPARPRTRPSAVSTGAHRPLAPCGTPAAYNRHWRRGEEPCDPCREANRRKCAEANRQRRQGDRAA